MTWAAQVPTKFPWTRTERAGKGLGCKANFRFSRSQCPVFQAVSRAIETSIPATLGEADFDFYINIYYILYLYDHVCYYDERFKITGMEKQNCAITHAGNTITKVLHTGALRCPDPGFRFATAQMALQKPCDVVRSIRWPSSSRSNGIASRPSSETERDTQTQDWYRLVG